MIEQEHIPQTEVANYKGRNYYYRHIRKTMPLVEYNNLDEEIERAGL
jgi:hypothetical protein